MKKKFYKEQFYKSALETTVLLDELHDANLLCVTEYYQDGTILALEATDCTDVREMLSSLILDMEAYITENNETFTTSEKNIPLTLLATDYQDFHKEKIVWDDQVGCFYSY